MFGILQRKRPQVYSHWYVLLLDFAGNAKEFYGAIEADLISREVPELMIERIPFREGGWLSANRIYLRIQRELLVFDICSAKFGTSWYFSCRGAVMPRSLRVWEILVFLAAVASVYFLYWQVFGFFFGSFAFGASALIVLVLFISARRWNGLDDYLLQLPVVGGIYDVMFRPDTYYRQDCRQMYLDLVDQIARAKVQEFALAGGVKDLVFKESQNPVQPTFGLIDRIRAFFAPPPP